MKKRYITLIAFGHLFLIFIIGHSLIGVIGFLYLFLSFLNLKNEYSKDTMKIDKIEEALSVCEHTQKTLFSYDDYLICYDKIASIGETFEVDLITDDCIIYYDSLNREYVIEYYNGSKKIIDISNTSGRYKSIIMKDSMLYSSINNDYYQYDIVDDREEKISKDEYYIIKNGNNYNIIKEKKSITVYDVSCDKKMEINIEQIFNEIPLLSNLSLNSFEILDYTVDGDDLYLNTFYKEMSIIVRYNLVTNSYDLYDWNRFYSGFYNSNKINFYLLSDEQLPPILNKYFIL